MGVKAKARMLSYSLIGISLAGGFIVAAHWGLGSNSCLMSCVLPISSFQVQGDGEQVGPSTEAFLYSPRDPEK